MAEVAKIAHYRPPCSMVKHRATDWRKSTKHVIVCGVCHPPVPGDVPAWIFCPRTHPDATPVWVCGLLADGPPRGNARTGT